MAALAAQVEGGVVFARVFRTALVVLGAAAVFALTTPVADARPMPNCLPGINC
jgi:hypothetical protein